MSGEWSEIIWTDIIGRVRSIRRPTARLAEPVEIARSNASAGFAPVPDSGGSLMLIADANSAIPNPHRPGDQIVLADLHEPTGEPSPLCARSTLRRTLDTAATKDIAISAAVELECYLVDPTTRAPVYDATDCYGIPRGDTYEPVLLPLRNALAAAEIAVEAANLEYSGGQFEVNIHHDRGLRAADSGVLLRLLLSRCAENAGLLATFMAKPWTDQAGSGMHVHQSLWDGDANVFADGSGGLSLVGQHYVGGMVRHLSALTLFGSPTVNAYHRRSPGSFAPTVACWGDDNRTLAIRSITGSSSATRIEQRDAAADCNIYLAMAAQFAAGLSGIEERVMPPSPLDGNAYERDDLEQLPRTFLEAFEALRDSNAARDFLGCDTVEAFLSALQPEVALLLGTCAQWERDRYMEPSAQTVL